MSTLQDIWNQAVEGVAAYPYISGGIAAVIFFLVVLRIIRGRPVETINIMKDFTVKLDGVEITPKAIANRYGTTEYALKTPGVRVTSVSQTFFDNTCLIELDHDGNVVNITPPKNYSA